MCKLCEKLEKASQPPPRHMGFAPRREEARHLSLVLVASLDQANVKLIHQASEVAEALLLHTTNIDSKKGPVTELKKLAELYPWGIESAELDAKAWVALREAKCDFVVFNMENTPGQVLSEESPGKVLSIGISAEERYLRTLEDLPVDILLVEPEVKKRSTVKDLLEYRSVLVYASKPALVRVSIEVSKQDLLSVREIGFTGVITHLRSADDLEKLSAMEKAIGELPPREDRGRPKVQALLTQPSFGPGETVPDEEDDDSIH